MATGLPSIRQNIPERVTECSLVANGVGSCLPEPIQREVVTAVGASSMEEARQKTGCDSEKCVITAAAPMIGHSLAKQLIMNNYKIEGPTDSTLLSNVNIDSILLQWKTGCFKDFFPYNFNMRNYTKYNYKKGYVEEGPDTLSTINVGDLYREGYRTAACVINADRYQGGGTHWMALFADMRDPKNTTVEFYNSGGGCAEPEWLNWLTKARTELQDVGLTVKIINCGKIVHQDSTTECGVYSLFYIWSRLNGTPAMTFQKQKVPDKLMFEFRQHLFADPKAVRADGTFDWDEFCKIVRVKWQ